MAKKLLVLILALMMVVMSAVPALAAEKPVADTGADTITVLFTDALNWGSVNVYYWENGPAWPGSPMTKAYINEYSQQVYSATIPANVTGIVFNGNGRQTVDITSGIVNGALWYTKSEMDYNNYTVGYVAPSVQPTAAPVQPTAAPSGDLTVYFTDAVGWGSANMYYWENGPVWPGSPMTPSGVDESGHQIYTATVPANVTGIVFNSNGRQTVDVTTDIVNGARWTTLNQTDDLAHYYVRYDAPSVQPTEAPVQPTSAPVQPTYVSGKALVSIYGIDGTVADTREFNVGDTFTVYTAMNASAVNSGKIASFSCTQSYTDAVLTLADSIEEWGFADLASVFPVTGTSTVSNATVPGLIQYNATNGSMVNPFVFDSNDDVLIKTTYTVSAPGTAEIRNGIKTLAVADAKLTRLVNKGIVLNNAFAVLTSFDASSDEPTRPVITAQPQNWTGSDGEQVSIPVTATGTGLTYQWYYYKADKAKWIAAADTDACYDSIVMESKFNGRRVYCKITDQNGKSVNSDEATISYAAAAGPVITTQPQSWTGADGEQVSIPVAAQGTGLTYQWYYYKADKAKWIAAADTDAVYDSIVMEAKFNGRRVYCKITDRDGNSVNSNEATISYAAAAGPVITTQPVSWAGNDGEQVSIPVVAQGTGLTYQWYYYKEDKAKWIAAADTDACYDSITMEAKFDGRRVYCKITDRDGNSVNSEEATISYAASGITITSQPADWTGANGAMTNIRVAAVGDGLTYRWYYRPAGKTNWIATTDTDAVYNIQMNTSRNGRQVYCKITDNRGNTVNSAVATMSMT